MRVIWKFPLHIGSQPLKAPKEAKILTVQMQGGVPMLWAIIDPHAQVASNRDTIHVVGTGHQVHDAIEKFDYIATVQEGGFVWHVFKEPFV